MIVCVCRGVSDHAIGQALARGVGTLPELAAACRGAGMDCGACEGMLIELLETAQTGVACAASAAP